MVAGLGVPIFRVFMVNDVSKNLYGIRFHFSSEPKLQCVLNLEFAFKYEMWQFLRMSRSLIPRIWLQYKLNITVCLLQKIFFNYHVLTTYFTIFVWF